METNIDNISKKASSTLGFIRRYLHHCPAKTRKSAYISLVRSTLEYGAIIWDPFLQSDIDKLERIQRKAVRFIKRDYRTRTPGCVSQMLSDLDLASLQQRRKELRLTFIFRIVGGLVPAIPSQHYLTPIRNKRKVKPRQFSDFVATNLVDSAVTNNNRCFKPTHAKSDTLKHSLFPKTIIEWNHLTDIQVNAVTVEAFKSQLKT